MKRIGILCLGLVALFSPTVVAAPAANAAQSCALGYICLYSGTNYTGNIVGMEPGTAFTCGSERWVADGYVSSVWNTTGVAIDLMNYRGAGATSRVGTAAAHKAYPGLGAGDNKTDTLRRYGC